jgi:cytochrome bd ubiquinol oxidase subunit I
MDGIFDHILLSRIQFGVTALFHILWPVLTIGLSIFLVLMEALWLKTRDEAYLRHCRFWSKLFLLNFSVGVVSGIPMEFQFGTNWGLFSIAGGDFFGHMLGFEAAMAFMLEATFLGIMVFGWKRVSPRAHLLSTTMVALGGSLSAFWIMVANSWMHTPTGGYFEGGKFVIANYWEAIFNPDMHWAVPHMWVACIEISLFVLGGISAWYIKKDRDTVFFARSFKIALICAIVAAPLQMWLGDGSGKTVYEHQPAKLAAMEAHWKTNPPGEGAPWKVLAWPNPEAQDNAWELNISCGLSLITTHSLTGKILGLREFPREDQPPVAIPFYAFRIMILGGLLLFGLAVWTVWAWAAGRLQPGRISRQKWLLRSWIAAIPVSYLAMEAGWVTREVGRQPWALYNLLRTADSVSVIPPGAAGGSLAVFSLVYPVLLILFLVFARHILKKGPEPDGSGANL